MKTGNTSEIVNDADGLLVPQWSPVMKTGNTPRTAAAARQGRGPQWSPVMKTGNTGPARSAQATCQAASMEPGHEDREYPAPS